MRHPALLSLVTLKEAFEHTIDLDYFLFINESDIDFVTSDCPVAVNNSWYVRTNIYSSFPSSEGYACIGVQFIFPISPKLLLCFYDPRCYRFGTRKSCVGKLRQRVDVERFNYLQVFKAPNYLYFMNISRTGNLLRYIHKLKSVRAPQMESLQKESEAQNGHFITLNSSPSRSLDINVHGVKHLNLEESRAIKKAAEHNNLTIKSRGEKYDFRNIEPGIKSAFDMLNKKFGLNK